MYTEAFISASQLVDLLAALVFLSFFASIAGVLVLGMVQGIGAMLSDYLDKRRKPPSAATLQTIARCLRRRAAVLEIKAKKRLLEKGGKS